MTKQQFKICKYIIRHKSLNKTLRKYHLSSYDDIYNILGVGNFDFSDNKMDDNTEIILCNSFIEEVEQRCLHFWDTWFTRMLAIAALIISIIALLGQLGILGLPLR